MPVIDSTPPTLSTFGSRLRYLREKKRLRQTEVAASVGMSQGNYSNLERDTYPGGAFVLQKIISLLLTPYQPTNIYSYHEVPKTK